MPQALYIELDCDEPGFDVFVDGLAIASAIEEFDEVCLEVGLPLIESFVAASDTTFRDKSSSVDDWSIDDDYDNQQIDQEPNWFSAGDGVAYLQVLLDTVEEYAQQFEDVDGVLTNLAEFLRILEQAQAARIQWRFAWHS